MPHDFLHNRRDFSQLIEVVSAEQRILSSLVEKDYWIMHCLYGLQQCGFAFELKGGTSLSKGWGIIHRFSEDIDIRIEPPKEMAVSTGRNHDKPAHSESRKKFFDWLASTIRIDGIHNVERDPEYDDKKLRNGGIRLHYPQYTANNTTLKEGILLEVGFDTITPNQPLDISSWMYDYAISRAPILDNRALAVRCYAPGYTLVEKLDAISRKFKIQQKTGEFPTNFIRHYYDVHALLGEPTVQKFLGTDAYYTHKQTRFRSEEPTIAHNDAFFLSDSETFTAYEKAYERTQSLYYRNRPTFRAIINRIGEFVPTL